MIDAGLAGPLLCFLVVSRFFMHGQWFKNSHPRTHFLGSKRVGTRRLFHTVDKMWFTVKGQHRVMEILSNFGTVLSM